MTAAFLEAFGLVAGRAGSAALRRAGLIAAHRIDAEAARQRDSLQYHNRHHFAETILAMGWLCAAACEASLISRRFAAAGVVAMVAHDMVHHRLGGPKGALEARSANRARAIARRAGVSPASAALIGYVIEGTDPALIRANAARARRLLSPGPHGRAGDLLRVLANEADVMASFLPKLGLALGDALAEELRGGGNCAGGALAASFTGRLAFLRRYAWFTPPAHALGLARIVARQTEALADRARDLDAMPERARARALYLDIVRSGYSS